MSTPLVSIIIPLYNREELVAETLQSLINQTYENWEALVVDDGSTDNSLQVVEQWSKEDKRIKVYKRHTKPKGASTCRNIGLAHASGAYIIFLDSDDLLATKCLSARVKHMQENPDLDFAASYSEFFYQTPGDYGVLWNIKNTTDTLLRFLQLDAPWGINSVIWTKQAITDLKGFDENCLSFQDWEIHVRALIQNYKHTQKAQLDCFCRTAIKHGSIGKNSQHIKHLNSHARLFQKIWLQLHKNEKLPPPKYKRAMSALFFWLLKRYLVDSHRQEALTMWKNSRYVHSRFVYYLILIYLKRHSKRGFSLYLKFVHLCLHPIYFNHFAYTHTRIKKDTTTYTLP